MCLGVPGRVESIVEGSGDQLAVVDVGGRRTRVNIGMLDDQALRPGDWVIVHMGFAMETIDAAAAAEAIAGLDMMEQLRTALADRHPDPAPLSDRTGAPPLG